MFRPSRSLATLSLAIVALSGAIPAARSQESAPKPPAAEPASPPAPNDYSDPDNWLCRPGKEDDVCQVDLTTTIVAADGSLTEEEWHAAADPPIDCFYVYPTASRDRTPNSDMIAGPGEVNVTRQHAARFASRCRVFAPLYRSFTLMALRGLSTKGRIDADLQLGPRDVSDAWNYYLEHDNGGRGVVLIGHSQGTGVLTQLIAEEIDGKPIEDRIVSALLLGNNVGVPPGKDVGGSFQHMPLCRSDRQIGCVITYVTFRSTVPPDPNSLFGRMRGRPDLVAGCTNPAALAGGSGELHPYLAVGSRRGAPIEWSKGKTVATPWVSVPGLLSAECKTRNGAHYLELTVHPDSEDPRADDIPGDIVIGGQPNAVWGLHLIDVGAAMGDLLAIVAEQTKVYLAEHDENG